MNCRICSGSTREILSLGNLYPSAFLAEGEEPRDRFPLTLVECNKCGLVQLKENPPLDTMYRQYWYRSGLNKSMVADLADVVKAIERKIPLSPGDLVLDIGCFLKDAQVMMGDFTSKPIVDINVGDVIINALGKPDIVINTFKREYKGNFIRLVIRDKKIICTEGHPIYAVKKETFGRGRLSFIPAGNLSVGDYVAIPKIKRKPGLVRYKGQSRKKETDDYILLPITEISMFEDNRQVYNLKIQDNNTFTVDGIAVHNCNDGALFKDYTQKGLVTVGYDPALNLKPECDLFFNNYFPDGSQLPKKAKIITSIAVFYDIPTPKEFIAGIKENLAQDGIWVIQLTDLGSMLKATAFDNIVHEHLEYYSLKVLVDLITKQGLQVFDAEYNVVNGGSLRVFVSWPNVYYKKSRVDFFLKEEANIITYDWEKLFQERIADRKTKTCDYIKNAKINQKTIALLGASTKGNTLLQVFGLDEVLIDHAAEVNSDKFGLYPVGTRIPIISEQESLKLSPDIYLVLPWHFAISFIKNKKFVDYMSNGGTLLFPLPEVVIWNKRDGKISGRFV